jgi:hypothetical protein
MRLNLNVFLIVLLAIANSMSAVIIIKLQKERDLYQRGAAIFEAGRHEIVCTNVENKGLSVDVKKKQPLCITAKIDGVAK